MNREEAIKAITDSGKTREQAEAFLNLVGSAFARRGWVEGEPLDPEGITANAEAFSANTIKNSDEE